MRHRIGGSGRSAQDCLSQPSRFLLGWSFAGMQMKRGVGVSRCRCKVVAADRRPLGGSGTEVYFLSLNSAAVDVVGQTSTCSTLSIQLVERSFVHGQPSHVGIVFTSKASRFALRSHPVPCGGSSLPICEICSQTAWHICGVLTSHLKRASPRASTVCQ